MGKKDLCLEIEAKQMLRLEFWIGCTDVNSEPSVVTKVDGKVINALIRAHNLIN